MPETAQKYELSFLRACPKVDISWDGLCISLCRRLVKYELSFLTACRKVHISRDSLQLLCFSLCRRLLKSMSYPFSENAERFTLAETVFNEYALHYAITLCRSLLNSTIYLFSEHAERLILSETVFDFYALAYVGDCSKSSETMLKNLVLAGTVFNSMH